MSQTNVLGERDVNIPPVGNAPNEKPSGGKKRKSEINPDDIDLGEDYIPEWSANQVRAKIRQFLNSGEMKVGEFQNKIGAGTGSYRRFMTQNGPHAGEGSETFFAAAEFFKKRQLAGIPISRKKAKADAPTDNETQGEKPQAKSKSKAGAVIDVSDIQLDRENTEDGVPIYDTCDDIRGKINRHLRETPGASNASFVRAVNAAVPAEDSISARQLSTFLNNSGATRGAESPAYYGAYVLFEKMRLKEGKPKTKKREQMETAWGRKGMDQYDVDRRGVYATPSEGPYVDNYGQVHFAGRR